MLYAHGLSKDADLDTAMANCFEAILGALYIDGGLNVAKSFLCKIMFYLVLGELKFCDIHV